MDPAPVLADLKRRFPTGTGYYLEGQPQPPMTIATYEPKDMTIRFGDSPDVNTIAHEFFHHLHSQYGQCERASCEAIAEHFADWYERSDRDTFACSQCGYPVPEADEWTMCFRCGAAYEES